MFLVLEIPMPYETVQTYKAQQTTSNTEGKVRVVTTF